MNIKITNPANGRCTIYTQRELAAEARALIRLAGGGRYLSHLVEVVNGTVRLMVAYVRRDGTPAETSEVL